MNTLTLLGLAAGSTLALNVLGFITARADAYLTKRDRKSHTSPSPQRTSAGVVHPTLPTTTVPVEETAGYWWKRLFTLAGMLGGIITPFQAVILLINSYLLAATLETMGIGKINGLFGGRLPRPATVASGGNRPRTPPAQAHPHASHNTPAVPRLRRALPQLHLLRGERLLTHPPSHAWAVLASQGRHRRANPLPLPARPQPSDSGAKPAPLPALYAAASPSWCSSEPLGLF